MPPLVSLAWLITATVSSENPCAIVRATLTMSTKSSPTDRYAWLIQGREGLALTDAGADHPESHEALSDGLPAMADP